MVAINAAEVLIWVVVVAMNAARVRRKKKKKLVVSVDMRWDSGRWSMQVHTGGVDVLACRCGIDRKRS